MKTNVILMHDQSLLGKLLYNIFVLPPMIKHQDPIQDQMTIPLDIVVEEHPVKNTNNLIILHIDNDQLLELGTMMIEVLLLHITPGLVMTTINYIRSYCSPYRSYYRSPYRRDSRPRHKSRSYSRDINFQRYTCSYRPPSRPRDFRYSRSRSHSHTRNKINNIQPQTSTDPINFEIHIYHPTEMANALTPTSWFYSLYTHASPNQNQRD